MLTKKIVTAIALSGVLMFAAGCSKDGDTTGYNKTPETKVKDKHEHGEHEHGDHEEHAGPHGGHVIELGEEEYHAEMTFDEKTRDIKIYMYGSDHDMKDFSPIDAKEVKLKLVVHEKPLVLTLKATPQKGDGEGKSSLFTLDGKNVSESIHDEEDIVGKLSVTTGGKSYNGEIAHDHDHEHGHEHGHDHDKEKGHDHDKDENKKEEKK